MKANEAPEKIYVYIPDDDIVGTASTQKGFPHQFVTEEYALTDAFIEKAEKFIYSALNDGIMDAANIEDFLRLFKKYMKGE